MDSHTPPTQNPVQKTVSREAWLEARKALLAKEKDMVHQLDALRAERSKMPWVRIDKSYEFDTPTGKQSLSDLFAGRSQLIVQHFMFGPDWEEGCVGCSLGADHMHGIWTHLEHHDVKFTAISRAPLDKIAAFKARMGWEFDWVSSFGSDFNYDYHVSFSEADKARGQVTYNFNEMPYAMDELPGISAFYKDENGALYHTYSVYARGTELVSGVFGMLDMAPKGRNETGPNFNLTDWVKHHDKYESTRASAPHDCGCGSGKT